MHFIYGVFSAIISPTAIEITGVNPAWKPPINLSLKRMPESAPYETHDIVVRDRDVNLAGTLYMPESPTPVPLVIVIPGSSDAGRKEWEYRGYGVALATGGVACFVYDKRNVGSSTHVAGRGTFDDSAGDALAIVHDLRIYPNVNPTRVGFLGLSQGGWIGTKAAAQTSDVHFLIFAAGSSRSVERQEADRVEYTLRDRKALPSDVTAALTYTRAMFDAAYGRAPPSDYEAQLDLLKAKPAWSDVVSTPDPGETAQEVLLDWQAQRYDPTSDLRSLRIPVLAFFGTEDVMVPPHRNVPAMNRDLRAAPIKRILVIDGANHGLFAGAGVTQISPGCPGTYWKWDRRASGVVEEIVQWAKGAY